MWLGWRGAGLQFAGWSLAVGRPLLLISLLYLGPLAAAFSLALLYRTHSVEYTLLARGASAQKAGPRKAAGGVEVPQTPAVVSERGAAAAVTAAAAVGFVALPREAPQSLLAATRAVLNDKLEDEVRALELRFPGALFLI